MANRSRLDALAKRLDAPLLVTNLTNVLYLTGFASSNAALLVAAAAAARRCTRTSATPRRRAPSTASSCR